MPIYSSVSSFQTVLIMNFQAVIQLERHFEVDADAGTCCKQGNPTMITRIMMYRILLRRRPSSSSVGKMQEILLTMLY